MTDTFKTEDKSSIYDTIDDLKKETSESAVSLHDEIIMTKTEVKEELYNFQTDDDIEFRYVKEEVIAVEYNPFENGIEKKDLGSVDGIHQLHNKYSDAFVCPFCKVEVMEGEESYRQHIKCCARSYIRLYKNATRKEIKKIFVCDKCNFVTRTERYLRLHIRIHSDKQFKCGHCDLSFRQPSQLKRHSEIHIDRKRLLCPFCRNTYYRKGDLKRHIEVKHLDFKRVNTASMSDSVAKKEYKCENCDYSTYHRSDLMKHVLIHSIEKPFKCTYKNCKCTDLRIRTQENLCECDICTFATSQKSSLRRHILVKHSSETKRFKCIDCVYSTHTKASLEKHVRIHTREKPFKCGYQDCNYSSANREHLKRHIKRFHTI